MALKYKIDAVDAEVRGLEGSFEALRKFASESAKSGSQWARMYPHAQAAVKTADALAHLLTQHDVALDHISMRQGSFKSVSASVGRIFSSLARDTKSMAENVARMSISFFDIASVAGVFGAIAGIGGSLFGIETGARNVLTNRRTALGLGVSYGAMQSFGVNLGRFVDPGMLSNVATGVYDIQSDQRRALMSAGINPEIGTATDQAVELLQKTPQMFANTSEGMIGPRARAMGLLNILSLEEIIRFRRASPAERQDQIKNFRKDIVTLGLSTKAQEAWSKFTTVIDGAGLKIEAILANKLAPLSEPLQKLSDAATKVVSAFMSSKFLTDTLNRLQTGLDWLATQVGSDKFIYGARHFLDGLSKLELIVRKAFDILKPTAKFIWYGGKYILESSMGPQEYQDWARRRSSRGYSPTASQFMNDVFGGATRERGGSTLNYRHDRPSIRHHTRSPYRDSGTGSRDEESIREWQRINGGGAGIAPMPGENTGQLADRIQTLYPSFSNQECVELARKVGGISEGVWDWRRGKNALSNHLPIGTPVSTFMDRAGNSSEFYDAHQGVGAPGNNSTHAGVVAGYMRNGDMLLANQWRGSGGIQYTIYKPNDPRGGEKDANNYFAINDLSGLPAGQTNPYREQVLRAMSTQRAMESIDPRMPEDPSIRARRRPEQTSMLHTLWGLDRQRAYVLHQEHINSTIVDANGRAYG